MTGITITIGRINHQVLMRHVFIFSTTVTAMADHATNFTVNILYKFGIIYEYFLPDLQRR